MNAYEKFAIVGMMCFLLTSIWGIRILILGDQIIFILIATLFIFGHKM